jgi:hypothetical protein
MKWFKLLSLLWLLLALSAGTSTAKVSWMPSSPAVMKQAPDAAPTMSAQLLRTILTEALEYWPQPHNCSYGMFRSAYNHGELTIEPSSMPGGEAYNVKYEGITVCVLIPA